MSSRTAHLTAGTKTAIDKFEPDYAARNDRFLTPLHIPRALGVFDLDPCAAPGHPTATTTWTPEDVGDGLSMPWAGRIWLNPPYGRTMDDWLAKMAEHDHGTALLFARTGTGTFQRYVFPHATALLFMAGRVSFIDPRQPDKPMPATAPSVLIAYGQEDARALRKSGIRGAYVPLPR